MIKIQNITTLVLLTTLLFLQACVKDKFDNPPLGCIDESNQIEELVVNGEIVKYTINQLKTDTSIINNSGLIDTAIYIEGIVVADDKSGNYFKTITIQDETGGVAINIDKTNFYVEYPIGRRIFVKLNGLFLENDNGNYGLWLQSLEGATIRIPNNLVPSYFVKGECNVPVEPTTININNLNNFNINTLVRIEGVEFVEGLDSVKFADAINLLTVNRTVVDCQGNQVTVRTSGFADFAGEFVPSGNGAIVGIYSTFVSGNFVTNQVFVRDMSDVSDMTNVRCDGSGGNETIIFSKDFQDQSITSGGWQNYTVTGNGFQWTVSDQGSSGNYYALATGFQGGSNATELWLISPALDLSSLDAAILNFKSSTNFNGPQLQLLVSTDYDGSSDPSAQGNWDGPINNLTSAVNWSPGSFSWTSSGNISLEDFLGLENVYIAFKYTSTSSAAATWQIDDIVLKE